MVQQILSDNMAWLSAVHMGQMQNNMQYEK